MRESYLHRLSRPYRPTVGATAEPAPEPDSGQATTSVAVIEREREAHARSAAPQTSYRRQRTTTGHRRRAVDVCEVCGRTLLAGERAREIVLGERRVAACPLCVIGAQRAARAQAA